MEKTKTTIPNHLNGHPKSEDPPHRSHFVVDEDKSVEIIRPGALYSIPIKPCNCDDKSRKHSNKLTSEGKKAS